MVSEINYAPRTNDKRELWSMKIDPKLKYLAETAAKDEGCSLSSFVDRAIRLALETKQKRDDAEPNSGHADVAPSRTGPLWGESMWHEDDANRFFNRAVSRHDLLSAPEKMLWQLFTMQMKHVGRRITTKAFRQFWNDPSINTTHVKDGE